jgi:hypothetical protein
MKNNWDSIRFALFVACMNSIYKGVLCFLRRFSDNDKKNAFIAGFMCGLAIIIDAKDRRIFIALILFSRALVRDILIDIFIRIHY